MISSAYIHIPFCTNICSYCDFCKMFYNSQLVNKYLDSLNNEIEKLYQQELLETIYIGGGTPSSLSIEELKKLFTILNKLKLNDNYEYTIECNIENITEEKLILFKQNNINRLSIGVQSFNKDVLTFLERNYTKQDIIEKISLAKKYFSNINIDLIYAVPNESIDVLNKDLDEFIKLDINHISTYSLIIEDNTKLKVNKTSYIDEDLDSDMYNLIKDRLKKNGYIHYEISNFTKPNYESKHNLNYWNNDHYYGFGLGASGYIDNYRYNNTRSINNYLDNNYILDKEILTNKLNLENEMMLGLRTIYGVNRNKILDKYNIDIEKYYDLNKLIKENLLIKNNDNYLIPEDKWYVENNILINFIGEKDE